MACIAIDSVPRGDCGTGIVADARRADETVAALGRGARGIDASLAYDGLTITIR